MDALYLDNSDWSVIAALLGIALIIIGGGITYAYRRILPYMDGNEGQAHTPPEMLVAIFGNFMKASKVCLIAGVVLLIGGHIIGPGLNISANGLGIIVPVSLFYAGALGLLLVILTYNVLHHRVRASLEAEGGTDDLAERITRVHANFTEYVPTGLGLLILLDLSGAPSTIIHVGGALFVTARYLHAYGYTKNPLASFGRIIGIQTTLLALAYMTVAALFFVLA